MKGVVFKKKKAIPLKIFLVHLNSSRRILVSIMLASLEEKAGPRIFSGILGLQCPSIQGRPYYFRIVATIGDYFKSQFKVFFLKMKFPETDITWQIN